MNASLDMTGMLSYLDTRNIKLLKCKIFIKAALINKSLLSGIAISKIHYLKFDLLYPGPCSPDLTVILGTKPWDHPP